MGTLIVTSLLILLIVIATANLVVTMTVLALVKLALGAATTQQKKGN